MQPVDAVELLAMRAALLEARAAGEAGEVPVGAVVLRDGEIIVRTQNRMRRDAQSTSHAELLALQQAMTFVGSAHLAECTLVVTLEPCAMCAGAIVLARPRKLVFASWDDKAGMCGSVGDVVRHPRLNHRPEVAGGIMAEESAVLLRAFFASRR